ncbi:aldo/keto reductase family protein [Paenibacillus agricola]|uniref:Aldo/keto reductase n=1 Tax=Paenibacillus agricola TaxID=2716264 RepID=A0ABX0JI11_9BACL|nr:aldo/keto reductase family protein [Paenibacillus agricola]NHN34936.1 aldo/keto reductase [Paenibacillus agricola]
MKYRRLGTSGLKVSEIGLGSWFYGTGSESQSAVECIRKAYELGINFFDNANLYKGGAAEVVLGQTLKDFPRASYVLATKVYFPMGSGPNDRGLSRKHIIEQCEASLQRLNVDYIDLYQCHKYDSETPLEETLRAMDDLISQGKVLYAGVSEWSAAQIIDAVHLAKQLNLRPLISNQPIYNMLVRYIEKEVLPVCERQGLGQVVFSPLAQGILTGKYRAGQVIPADSRAANDSTNKFIASYLKDGVLYCVERLEKVAQGMGVQLPEMALAWVLRQPGVSSAIIGASRPSQIENNVKALEIELTPDLLREIEDILIEIDGFAPAW